MDIYVLWTLVGAVVGILISIVVGHNAFVVLVGAAIGWLGARQTILSRAVDRLRQELQEIRARANRPTTAPPAAEKTAAASKSVLTARPSPPPAPWVEAKRSTELFAMDRAPGAVSRSGGPGTASPGAASPTLRQSAEPVVSSLPERAFQQAWNWLSTGNVPVKVGILVIFVGVAAALKYASDIGLLQAPISVRLSLIAVAATTGLGFGWLQRTRRRVFALSLQGGAVGVLVLTVFAAFHLYHLLPAPAAFALLVLLVGGIGLLAVWQDALALAVLGLVAGFAAPILVSTGQGNHIVLFSYYALLNLAILGIAWRRAWRVLNVLGFVATFGIGTAWGVLRYDPAQFASTEPFLVLNFLFYLAIPWLYLRQPAVGHRRVMDGSLLFGNPLVSLLLQGALLRWDRHSLALSTLAVAVVYLLCAFGYRSREKSGVLGDGWAMLAVIFATLTVPLAFGAHLTGSILAVEGAGMVWLGFRQQRTWSRLGGLGLQVFAIVALLAGRWTHSADGSVPVLNGDFISLLFVVMAAFASCTLYARREDSSSLQRGLAVALFLWGMIWWWFATGSESVRFGSMHSVLPVWMALLAFTAWLVAEGVRRRPRHELGEVMAWSVPVLLAIVLPLLLWAWTAVQQPLWGWALPSAALAGILGWRTLICLREEKLPAALAQLAWLWRWGLIVLVGIAVAMYDASIAPAWKVLLPAAPLLLLFGVALHRPAWIAPPLPKRLHEWRPPLLYSLLLVAIPVTFEAMLRAGDASPLPFVPLLNPTDILLMLIGVAVFAWLSDPVAPASLRQQRAPIMGLWVVLWLTSATLRGVHQLGEVPWNMPALGSSSLAQMALTLLWSVMGLLAWVVGSRRGQRAVWLAGAGLMTVVLLKLLLVDREHLGNVFGIASFIVYGLLCTLIGYLAPAPPKQAVDLARETRDAP